MVFDYALAFLPEGWAGLNDVLAPPQLKKLGQESTVHILYHSGPKVVGGQTM